MRDIETRHRYSRSDWGNDQVSPRQNSFKHQEPTVSRRDDTIETSVPDSFEVGQADVVAPRPNRTFDEPTPRMLVDPNTYTNRRNEINRDQTLAQSQGGISKFDQETGKSYRVPTPLEVQEAIRGTESMSRGLDQYSPEDSDIAQKELGALESDYNAFKDAPDFDGLTTSETEVMEYVSQGYSYAEIAQMRVVSERTVRNQVQAVRQKTGYNGTTTGLAVDLLRQGYLFQEPPETELKDETEIEIRPEFKPEKTLVFTDDQRRVIELMARGHSDGAIAIRMGIDEKTVAGLIHTAKVRNNHWDRDTSLVIKAIQEGWVSLEDDGGA